MGILDEAIKEHLELKRQHGAAETELKRLEDEAFGPADRPGTEEAVSEHFTEAPTEFMSQPEVAGAGIEKPATGAGEPETTIAGEEPTSETTRRAPAAEIADLQEAPLPPEAIDEEAPAMEHAAVSPPPEEAQPAGASEPLATDGDVDSELEAAHAEATQEPTQEAEPASEPELTEKSEPPADAGVAGGPSTEERQAISEQPTELFDVAEELAASQAGPSEEELVEEEIGEPRLAPADPLTGLEAIEEAEPSTSDTRAETAAGETAEAGAGESTEAAAGETAEAPAEDDEDDFFDEKRLSDELDQALEAPFNGQADEAEPAGEGGWHTDEHEALGKAARSSRKGDDLLDETPDFLEELPEDDQLWFEQKPPKDFDFDD